MFFCVCLSHRHVEGIDKGVAGAVNGPLSVKAGDVEQRAIGELVGPVHLQGRFADGAGSTVQQLGVGATNTQPQSTPIGSLTTPLPHPSPPGPLRFLPHIRERSEDQYRLPPLEAPLASSWRWAEAPD